MSLLPSRRQDLQALQVTPTTHAGLWLDKYTLHIQTTGHMADRDEADPRQSLVAQAADIPTPALYTDFFARWQQALIGLGAQSKRARTLGRIAIGLGNESVIETAITLHHTYGVPYLPGSALKGLAAGFAAQRLGPDWQESSAAYRTVFGTTAQAGYVTFFDAYPFPQPKSLLQPDIMAIHHPGYYQKAGESPPADWDDPNLVPFPTATGAYLIALAGPRAPWADAWVTTTFQILGFALAELGIGAKTSSGYGRLVFDAHEQAPGGAPAASATGQQPPPQESYALAKKRLLSEEPPPGRQRGAVRNTRDTYAFIAAVGGGAEVFVHQSDLRGGQGPLRNDQVVEFRLIPAAGKQRPKATDVVVLLQPHT
jgi:CRISPR-associated protein Cmr6